MYNHKNCYATDKFTPRVDIVEDDERIYFDAELPGVAKEDVVVSIGDGNVLTIKGEKKNNTGFAGKYDCRNERLYGSFERSFRLPDIPYTGKIEARYDNGILHVSVDKSHEEPKETVININ